MKLQSIFDQLTTGEFSQMNIGAAGQGVIDDTNMDKVVNHINLGLTDLYTRFELKMSSILLQLQAGQTNYLLTSKSAVNGRGAVDPKFIIDTQTSPFKDDILTVQRVYSDTGFEMPLNRLDVAYSLMTSSANRLEVPLGIVQQDMSLPCDYITANLQIAYRANHPLLDMNIGAFDPERLEIELPSTHLTALLYFVASRANNPVGLGQEFNAGNTYAAKYQAECARLKNDGMEIQQRGGDSKFGERGFV